MSDKEIAPGILRMDAGEIDLLDQENAVLELDEPALEGYAAVV